MANNKNHYLTYTFTIENQTDPTPSETVYNVKLYIDLNADGRYADTEALDNIDVFDSNGVLLSPDSMYRLSAGMEYKVQRLLPDSYVGIIPWKLEVTKIGAEHIHASANNYSRIAAVNKQTIKILQIAPSNRSGTELNLQEQLKADTVNRYSQLLGSDGVTYYKGIYGKLIADLEDFDVDITTIEADDLERKGSDDEIFSYLDGYEMLIIGFADMYGEIESNTAAAITQFIDTQKSVLFTHDTTSLSNVSNRNILQIKDENLGDSENIVFLQPWQRSSTNFITVTNNSNTNYSSLTIDYNSKKYELQWVKRGKRWEQVWVLVSESDTEQYAYQEMTLAPGHYTVQCTLNSDSALTLDIGVCENYRVNNPINRMPNIEAASAPKTCTFTFEITGNVSRNVQLYIKQASVDNNGKVYVTSMTVKKNAKAASKLFYSGCDPSYWGYYFNTVIRDSVGLDRYGITSSSLKSFLFDSNVLTSPADDSLIGRILSNNRSVAYMPGSAATKTVPEVQGFTNYSLIRYGSASSLKYTNNDYSERTTTTVSQVNEGQITTYPYNINTAAFDGRIGSGSYMRVGLTHEQYYQLNMNTDDIVVWYCLSGGAAVSDNTNYVSASNGWTYTANGNKLSPTFDNRSVDSRIYFNGNYANKIPAGTYTLTCRLRNDSRAQSAQIGVEGNGIAGKVYEQYNYTNGGYTDVSFTFTVTNTTQSFSLFFWWEGYNSRNSAKCLFQNISIKAAKSASYYNDSPNDVVNSYYIYTKGNVTYSGVGHSSANSNYTGNNIGEQYINEAKLFVNTMIAAYQAAGQVPTVSIKRSQTSSADLDSKYFVTENVSDGEETAPDEDTLLEQKLGRRESYAVYFKISDPNLTTDKTISVSFYCMPKTVIGEDGVDEVDENGFIKLTGEAYIASTDSEADQENLTGGVVYKLYVCDLKYTDNNGNTVSLDKLLAQKNISSIDLYVQICTTIGKQPLIGDDYISLRKVGLFELS